MGKYKCVIFDCDGVLVDSETIAARALVNMANELGANIKEEDAASLFKGKSFSFCMDVVSTSIGKPLPETFEADYRAKSFKAFKESIKPLRVLKRYYNTWNYPIVRRLAAQKIKSDLI
ncbi:hypothetical protein [Flavivirga sp. 57AJ16]|uniref:hypothetical protein n=1 Tax=Flavivirga sp. 57AJ16 TaxID=3025307 RepID=UPI002366E1BC|nr:hypothetical protein [Flavivirga sp. 57AJ16]MDD7886366.1 hypothetical protein [Flavivirga sp. 57AJ16]